MLDYLVEKLGNLDNCGEVLAESDLQHWGEELRINLGEGSVMRRMWEYDQNDFMRHLARNNPIGSEKKFLEHRGERFGETVYSVLESALDEDKEVYLVNNGETQRYRSTDAAKMSREIINSLAENAEPDFYESALEALERQSYNEGIKEHLTENQI